MTPLGHAIRRRLALVAVASTLLLAFGVTGAATAYAHMDTTIVHRERVDWTERANYTYEVPVERNATLWPHGTILPMGLPAYYRTITRNVTIAFAWSGDADAEANATMTLRIRAETPDGRAYWSFERALAEAAAPPGEALQLRATLDMDALVSDVIRISRELPIGEGRVNWSIDTRVTHARGTTDLAFPFDVPDPRILLPAPDAVAWERAHTTPHDEALQTRAGWTGAFSSLSSLALVATGTAGLGLAAWARWSDPGRGRPERDALYRREHALHAEWITIGGPVDERRLPPVLVDVPTLAALVETAADARTRVVLDAKRRVYYALLPNVAYRYARHARTPARSAPHRAAPTAPGVGKKAAR